MALASAVVAALGIARTSSARSTASWTVPISGGWFEGSHWSSATPPNAEDVDVVIAASGAHFTVGFASYQTATVRTLTLDASRAELLIQGASGLNIAPGAGSGITVNSGTLSIFNGGSISGGRLAATGGTVALSDCTLDGMTLAGPITGASNVIVRNNLALDNAAWGAGGRIVFDGSPAQTISGTGTISLGTNSEVDTSAPTDLTFGPGITLRGAGYFGGGSGRRIIQGTLMSTGSLLVYDGIDNSFTNEGLVDATSGSIYFYPGVNVTNFDAGTIRGGSWAARNGSTIIFTAGTINANAATISLAGANSSFTGLQLTSNVGTLLLSDSQTFSTPGALTNAGTIGISTTARLAVNGALTNNGTIGVTSGGVFRLDNVVNNGTIALSNSTLQIGSVSALTAPIGAFSMSGGTLDMAVSSAYTTADLQPILNGITGGVQLDVSGGTLDLAGGTLPVVGPKITARLAGGAVANGSITSPDGTRLAATRGTSTLSNVSLQADCALADGASLNLYNSVIDGRRITLSGGTGASQLRSVGTIGSNLPGASPATIEFANSARNVILPSEIGNSVALGANVTARTTTGSGTLGAVGMSFTNSGTILATGTGRAVSTRGAFLNTGTMIATTSGTLRLADATTTSGQMPTSSWSNTGTIRADAGGTIILGGTIQTGSIGAVSNNGGTITLSAYVNNAGTTLELDALRGSWRSVSSYIEGGTLATSSGSKLMLGAVSVTTLDNVSNTGTISIAGTMPTLNFSGTSRNSGWIERQQDMRNLGTLTNVGTIATDTGGGAFVNAGTLSIRDGGRLGGIGIFTQSSQAFTRVSSGGTFAMTDVRVSTGTFSIEAGGTATIANEMQVIAGGTLAVGGGGAVSVGTLSLISARAIESGNGGIPLRAGALSITQPNGKLDLTDGDLIVGAGTPASTIVGYVRSGYHFGTFDGAGIISTTAAINPSGNTTLGVLVGQEYLANNGSPTFDGIVVNATDSLVKYTYFGDVDFNGAIDSTDYNLIDFGFLTHASGWANGDVDYSGAVDSTDYNLIDFAFVTQNGFLRRAISYLDGSDRSAVGMNDASLQEVVQHFEQFGNVYAAGFLSNVPEPVGSAMLLIGSGALLARRRRSDAPVTR